MSTTLVRLNLGSHPQKIAVAGQGVAGRIRLNTYLDRQGEEVREALALRPDEGVMVEVPGS